MADSPSVNERVLAHESQKEEDIRNTTVLARVVIGMLVVTCLFFLFRLIQNLRRGSVKKAFRYASTIALIILLTPAFLRFVLLDRLSGHLNPVFAAGRDPPPPTEAARKLFESSLVADMHADTLLWTRSLLADEQYGHVDLPRLLRGNVALQGFGIVTRVPAKISFQVNDEPSVSQDPVLLLALFGQWGLDALTSLPSRCLAQCAKLRHFAAESNGQLRVIRFREDLKQYLADRSASTQPITAGYLGIEGLQALGGKLENLEAFYDAGVRTIGLTHFYDNDIAGSAHGRNQGGLTELGKQAVYRMAELGIFVDIAHLSSQSISEVCALNDALPKPRPIVASHAGVRGVCDNPRNLKDEHLQCIARSGGLIGIGFFRPAICGDDELDSIVDTIRYVRDLVGIEHVAFGSDFDGAVSTPFDVANLIYIVDRLLKNDFTEDEIKLIVGQNLLHLFATHLPSQFDEDRR